MLILVKFIDVGTGLFPESLEVGDERLLLATDFNKV